MRVVVALLILVALYLVFVGVLFLAGKKAAAKEVALLLPNLLRLFKGLISDRRVSRSCKWLLVFGAVWIASPIDLIPEFVPVLGPLDDAIVAALILRFVLKRTPPEVLEEHWHADPKTLAGLLGTFGVHSESGAQSPYS
jgi:uncharacterized membrane protein YkvA (DUF1232 family)